MAVVEAVRITVEFDREIQSFAALQEAAYRLIGTASCQLEQQGGRYLCHLSGETAGDLQSETEALRRRFLDLVTDENLRERVSTRTEGLRNVILALAFGSMAAAEPDDKAA